MNCNPYLPRSARPWSRCQNLPGVHVDAIAPNRAFESGRAEAQLALGLRPWRRAAQRERQASKPATIYIRLATYRWWVGLWSVSNAALWLEIPNETVDYFERVVKSRD